MTIILFDIDGTLVDCAGAGRKAMERAFGDLTGQADACTFPFAGGTDRAIARQGLDNAGHATSESSIAALLDAYLRHLPEALMRTEAIVHEGVHELLTLVENLEHRAIGLGTGNVEKGARAKLGRVGLADRFAFGGFGCDAESRAELIAAGIRRGAQELGKAPSACEAIIIGDTIADVEAANANGARTIAVATGRFTVEMLSQAGAALSVDTLADPRVAEFFRS